MKSGTCPKCGSTEIHVKANPHWGYNYDNLFIRYAFWGPGRAQIERYVCMDCGLIEQYVHSRGDIEEIQKHWPHILEREKREKRKR